MTISDTMALPNGGGSVFDEVMLQSDLSRLVITYNGFTLPSIILMVDYINGTPNSPANTHWTLQIQYTQTNETVLHDLEIIFLPTGEIDHTQTSSTDWTTANIILSPAIHLLSFVQIDFFGFLDYLFISYNWTILANLG